MCLGCIEERIPLKQGLKPYICALDEEDMEIEERIPLKQGLKQGRGLGWNSWYWN